MDFTEFQFDAVLPPTALQVDVYNMAARAVVLVSLPYLIFTFLAMINLGSFKHHNLKNELHSMRLLPTIVKSLGTLYVCVCECVSEFMTDRMFWMDTMEPLWRMVKLEQAKPTPSPTTSQTAEESPLSEVSPSSHSIQLLADFSSASSSSSSCLRGWLFRHYPSLSCGDLWPSRPGPRLRVPCLYVLHPDLHGTGSTFSTRFLGNSLCYVAFFEHSFAICYNISNCHRQDWCWTVQKRK